MKIVVIFTCFNRREKTGTCIRSLVSGNPKLDFEYIVVNDGSTDGTGEMLEKMKTEYNIHHINSYSNLYYSRGMRIGMSFLKTNNIDSDYVLILNDDVLFFERSIEKLICQSREKEDSVIVGVTCDANRNYTYGAIKYRKGIQYYGVGVAFPDTNCDTFNANCVLIPRYIFNDVPSMDSHYIHGLGDFDYGLSISKRGYKIYPSNEYIGECVNNSQKGTWTDTSLNILERIQKKETPKGAPLKPWFYFLKKNFGLGYAFLYSLTPYLKIVLGR